MTLNIATRVHNHNYALDPYVRSLLDTDFYKILMAFFIWRNYPEVRVTFAVKNRTKSVKLASTIPESELRAQLDHVKGLRFSKTELIWLAGNSFYGQSNIFPGDFIEALRNLQLPDYDLSIGEDGDYLLSFTGTWFEVTLWEIYALSVINEARSRAAMADMSKYQLSVLYANATTKLVGKLKTLREAGVQRIAEFGTRRRHGFLWQAFVIEAMQEELGDAFLGTSNALHAMRTGLEAIGTNAHELPMVMAALSRIRRPGDTQSLFSSQYRVLREWQDTFQGKLLVGLPDTYGTTQFLDGLPAAFPDIKNWTGFREDSKDPFVGGEEKIAFWNRIGVDPTQRLQLFSDGLDVEEMIALHKAFSGRILDGYGWGTRATNDFRGCDPRGGQGLDPISLVCKVSEVFDEKTGGSAPAVKLSDNFNKATGPESEIDWYRKVFGSKGVAGAPVEV